jgi:Fanconi-associated nuclease 1
MLGQRIAQPPSTDLYDDDVEVSRPLKRTKIEHSSTPGQVEKAEIADSDVGSDNEDLLLMSTKKTDLESALPDIRTDQEAIDEYEAQRASQAGVLDANGGYLKEQKWVRGKSSIYVDAFNLALQTVLDEESHLFDDAEKALFEYWNSMGYEAQYLFVLLTPLLTLSNASPDMFDCSFERLLLGTERTSWAIIVTFRTSMRQ